MIGAFEFDEEEIEANERAVAAVYARDGDFVFVAPDRQSLMRGFDLSQAFEG
jgi:hypothetical protein